MVWLLIISLVIVVGVILYWQLIIAEGAYLGAPIVALLYDWTAERYNQIKEFDPEAEAFTLGRPLTNRLTYHPSTLVLDVATGTGRLPHALLRQPFYKGKIIGLDRASKMLAVARRELDPRYSDRVLLVQADAMALPFADNSLPVVSCLEALEFLPNPKAGLSELIRVLQPASGRDSHLGWLLFTNRVGWEAKLIPGKTWSRAKLNAVLAEFPLQCVDVQIWETIYDLIWAQKIKDEPATPQSQQ